MHLWQKILNKMGINEHFFHLLRYILVNYFVAPWPAAHEARLRMGYPRQEYWSGLLFPSPGDLPRDGWNTCPGMEPMSLHWQADSLPLSHQGSPIKEYTEHNKGHIRQTHST